MVKSFLTILQSISEKVTSQPALGAGPDLPRRKKVLLSGKEDTFSTGIVGTLLMGQEIWPDPQKG